ncbi:MAG: 4Fe-4S binding protein [Bacteroidales bacterium]
MASKAKKTNYYRISLQYIIILLLVYMVFRAWFDKNYIPDFEAYCPIGGMQAYSSFLVNNSLACSMTTLQIAMGFALLAGVILFAKLFCSYICPIGTFTEWLGRLGEKRKLRYTLTGWPDKALRLLKYALMFITFYFTVEASELFCRKYDPFYAIFTGFSGDVNLWYALIAIAVTIFGSFFIRQFWCKYLCPLGAVTNLVAFTGVFAIITALYLILILVFHLGISWIWYLGTVSVAGFILEAFKVNTCLFPLFKITRNENICTNCKICDKACPYALDISTADKVRHIDCHLCGDCVTRCPEKGALSINRRPLRWLPPVAVVVLVTAGILFSSNTQIPTIDLKWGTPEQMENASIYTQHDLKSVKCYGSSMSFANQLKEIKGIVGVQTFVKTYTAKIFFDPSLINIEEIKAAMFNPVKEIIALPGKEVNQLFMLSTGIDHFFDPADAAVLSDIFSKRAGIYGFETQFGEPVKTLIYYDENKIKPNEIKALIETRELEVEANGVKKLRKLNYSVAYMKDSPLTIFRKDFLHELFTPYSKTFNDYEMTDTLALSVYEIPFMESLLPDKKDMVPYLRNHLMADKGLVKFLTEWRDEAPVLKLYYIPGKTTPEALYLSLIKPKLHVVYKSGETEDIDNPFDFPEPGVKVQ